MSELVEAFDNSTVEARGNNTVTKETRLESYIARPIRANEILERRKNEND